MRSNEFLSWYLTELQRLLLEEDRINRAKTFIEKAIRELQKLSRRDLRIVLRSFAVSHKTRLLGDFNISAGDRDECDFLEEINGTIEFFIEDELMN